MQVHPGLSRQTPHCVLCTGGGVEEVADLMEGHWSDIQLYLWGDETITVKYYMQGILPPPPELYTEISKACNKFYAQTYDPPLFLKTLVCP